MTCTSSAASTCCPFLDGPGFAIFTANIDDGLSEEHRKWTPWKDLQVARLFKIDGEA